MWQSRRGAARATQRIRRPADSRSGKAPSYRAGAGAERIMRAVVQRVAWARVEVGGEVVAEIEPGLAVLVGVAADDTEKDADYLADKLVNLRVFEDDAGRLNLSALDLGHSILAVSNFTVLGDTRKGRRPSFTDAAEPQKAEALYERLVERMRATGVPVQTGRFREKMQVSLCNDGPVTLVVESRQ